MEEAPLNSSISSFLSVCDKWGWSRTLLVQFLGCIHSEVCLPGHWRFLRTSEISLVIQNYPVHFSFLDYLIPTYPNPVTPTNHCTNHRAFYTFPKHLLGGGGDVASIVIHCRRVRHVRGELARFKHR